jgi:hypothetical protein
MFPIEKGVAVPATRSEGKYPFRVMEIGDSFFVPCEEAVRVARAHTIKTAAKKFRAPGQWRFVVRSVPAGIRVWKVTDERAEP